MQILFVVMKMKRTNSICIFLCIGLVALALIFFAIAKTSEKDQREAEEEDRMLLTENSSIPSASENQAKYMVLLENDTVVVYEIVDWKKYLTTDIAGAPAGRCGRRLKRRHGFFQRKRSLCLFGKLQQLVI